MKTSAMSRPLYEVDPQISPDYLAIPIEYVPVHSQSAEPSALTFPEQPPEPLMPSCFPVPLTIFHLLAAAFEQCHLVSTVFWAIAMDPDTSKANAISKSLRIFVPPL